MTADGKHVICGSGCVEMAVNGKQLQVQCLVLERLPVQFEVIVGMDIIENLGGVTVGSSHGGVEFGAGAVAIREPISIEDVDFHAVFDGKQWTVRWKWIKHEPSLRNHVACYKIDEDVAVEFDREVADWIQEGILEPVEPGVSVESVIPLMAVEQINKGKVRPVLDFLKLNSYV